MIKSLMPISESLLVDALEALKYELARAQFITRKVFNPLYTGKNDSYRDKEINALLSFGFIGKLRRQHDKRCVFYFITYRGRKYLAENGDKSQIKYLNLQNA